MLRDTKRNAYAEKTRAEVAGLVARGVRVGGNAFSAVLLVKGAAADDGQPFSERERAALAASLDRLGYLPEDWEWLLATAASGEPLEPALVREALAVLDPTTVVLVDELATQVMRDAFAEELVEKPELDEAMLAPGAVAHVRGMRMMSLGDFAAALEDERAKQRAWAWLKQLAPLGEPY